MAFTQEAGKTAVAHDHRPLTSVLMSAELIKRGMMCMVNAGSHRGLPHLSVSWRYGRVTEAMHWFKWICWSVIRDVSLEGEIDMTTFEP